MKLTCLDCGQANRVPHDRLALRPKCGTCGAALVPSDPVDVDLDTLRRAIRQDGLPLVVDFWAPWCGPCRMMAPEYARAAALLRGTARLVKINTDAEPAAAQAFGIRGIPTLMVAAGGQERARKSGVMQATALADWVRRAAGVSA